MRQLAPTALRTLQVFEIFSREQRPLTGAEIARHLSLPASSCSDLLSTMRSAGYLLRMPRSRRFYPSARLLSTARAIAETDPLQTLVAEVLEQLTRLSGESSLCGRIEADKVEVVACKESPRALRYVLQPGTLIDLHSTSVGKAALGAMPASQRKKVIAGLALAPATEKTIVSRKELEDEVARGAARGWYAAFDEGSLGVSAIAISTSFDGMILGFALVGPTHRFTENQEAYVEVLLKVRQTLFNAL